MASAPVRWAYPVQLDERADAVLVTFPDIPEALTEGATVEKALAESADCLLAALGGYVRGGARCVLRLGRMVASCRCLH